MAEKLQITIVGLGLIGSSAGLALRRYADKVSIVGHDKDSKRTAKAKKVSAVDRTEWNLISAVSEADRVLLALPADQIKSTLAAIAKDLKTGCILVDTADVKKAVLQWAVELLPKDVHLIGGHPILMVENPSIAAASASLFENKLFCLTPDATSEASAVRLAADLVEAMGAKPFFLDAAEHDSMIAAVEHIPAMLAGAILDATCASSSWLDMRKLAASQFYSSTLIMAESGPEAAAACAANRESVLHWLDQLMAGLRAWRQDLADGDNEALAEAFDRGLEARRNWLGALSSGNWEEVVTPELPTSGMLMRSMIGFGPPKSPAPAEKKK
jgi:prephenate dehydrogenase